MYKPYLGQVVALMPVGLRRVAAFSSYSFVHRKMLWESLLQVWVSGCSCWYVCVSINQIVFSSFCRVSYVCEWIGCSISWVATSDCFFPPCIGVFVCMEHLQIQFAMSHRAPLHSAGSTTINARVDNQAPRLVSLRSKANDIHSSLSIPIYLISQSLYLVVSCLTLWCFNLVFPLLKLIRLLVF